MKRLWKYIPPCLSDVQGFQAIINETDGAGIIDDPSRYKPIKMPGSSVMNMNFGRRDMSFSHGGPNFGGHGGRGDMEHGRNAGRIFQSDLRNEDIISGTEKKLAETWEKSVKPVNPSFVLLSNAPSSAMISSDLETAAENISADGKIPSGVVKIYGDKDYLYGMSQTLEAMGKIILKKRDNIDESVNILGCNCVDWNEETIAALESLLKEKGLMVISKWGAKGMKKEILEEASAASLNLVVNISGLKLAKYMESEFKIPYIVGAPYGKEYEETLIGLIGDALSNSDMSGISVGNLADADEYNALIIGEQFMANAIRSTLRNCGYNGRVLSFYEMSKDYMEPGDKKLNSEDELREIARSTDIKLIIADPDYKMAAGSDAKWINLPNSGMSIINPIPTENFLAEKLDNWFLEAGI